MLRAAGAIISARLKVLLITTRQMEERPLLSTQGEEEMSRKRITVL